MTLSMCQGESGDIWDLGELFSPECQSQSHALTINIFPLGVPKGAELVGFQYGNYLILSEFCYFKNILTT